MAILRAGPWGNLIDSFQDVPAATNVELDYYPVNLALGDWPNQTWACFATTDQGFIVGDPYYIYSKANLGEEVSRNASGELGYTPTVNLQFCYQATNQFDVNFNWSLIGPPGGLPSLYWSYTTIEGLTDSFFNTPEDSGTEIISLPPTTFGYVSASIQGYLLDPLDLLTVIASFSAPA